MAAISTEMLDELLAGQDPMTVLGPDGLPEEPKKTLGQADAEPAAGR